MRKSKPRIILEVIIVIGLIIYSFIKVSLPNYNKIFGSSDRLISTKKYASLVEFKIGETNFGIVLNNKKEVYHLLFFDETSSCLYNQNIENNSIDIVSNQIIRLLIENNYLKNDTIITITKYNNKYYEDVKKEFITYLNKYHLNNEIIEDQNTIINKAKSISNEEYDSNKSALLMLDLYSKEVIDSSSYEEQTIEEITEKDSKRYANKVYITIEKYMNDNNIKELEKGNKEFDITKVPGDERGLYYPTENSYYYIKNSKLYAYIEIKGLNNIYSYCYNGSIDEYMKGECK